MRDIIYKNKYIKNILKRKLCILRQPKHCWRVKERLKCIKSLKFLVENEDVQTALKGILKKYSTFLEIGSFYHSPRVKQLGFYRFRMY